MAYLAEILVIVGQEVWVGHYKHIIVAIVIDLEYTVRKLLAGHESGAYRRTQGYSWF